MADWTHKQTHKQDCQNEFAHESDSLISRSSSCSLSASSFNSSCSTISHNASSDPSSLSASSSFSASLDSSSKLADIVYDHTEETSKSYRFNCTAVQELYKDKHLHHPFIRATILKHSTPPTVRLAIAYGTNVTTGIHVKMTLYDELHRIRSFINAAAKDKLFIEKTQQTNASYISQLIDKENAKGGTQLGHKGKNKNDSQTRHYVSLFLAIGKYNSVMNQLKDDALNEKPRLSFNSFSKFWKLGSVAKVPTERVVMNCIVRYLPERADHGDMKNIATTILEKAKKCEVQYVLAEKSRVERLAAQGVGQLGPPHQAVVDDFYRKLWAGGYDQSIENLPKNSKSIPDWDIMWADCIGWECYGWTLQEEEAYEEELAAREQQRQPSLLKHYLPEAEMREKEMVVNDREKKRKREEEEKSKRKSAASRVKRCSDENEEELEEQAAGQ
jgi:hypothetical protein